MNTDDYCCVAVKNDKRESQLSVLRDAEHPFPSKLTLIQEQCKELIYQFLFLFL